MLLAAAIGSFVFGFQTAGERFDQVVRRDFFMGFSGDTAALDRAMKTAEAVLKENPDQAEALVWQGAGYAFLSGRAFRDGDQGKGMEYWEKATSTMDRAVGLQPRNISVRIPRAATLAAATRSPAMPDFIRTPLMQAAMGDYEQAYQMQKSQFDSLSEHARGELLLGMADLQERLGQVERSRALLEIAATTLPKGAYAGRARKWLDGGTIPDAERTCLGCHAAK